MDKALIESAMRRRQIEVDVLFEEIYRLVVKNMSLGMTCWSCLRYGSSDNVCLKQLKVNASAEVITQLVVEKLKKLGLRVTLTSHHIKVSWEEV